MNLPIFSKNPYEAAQQIVDIIDEVVAVGPDDGDPNRSADVGVNRLAAAVNLYGGARMAIGIRLLDLFNNQWHTFSSIARENGCRTEAESLHMVMEYVGLDMQVNDQQLFQLKNFMCGVLPALRRNKMVKPEEELEYVVQCLNDSHGLSISANMRNAILFVNKNKQGITPEEAEKVKRALDKKEMDQELEQMAGSRRKEAIPRLECQMNAGPEETVFIIRASNGVSAMVEKVMERYFDVKPY